MNEDKIIEKLLEHDTRMDSLEEKIRTDIAVLRNEFLDGQDKMMKILIRLDEERHFTVEAIRRMQEELDTQKKEIRQHDVDLNIIKTRLQIA